MRIETFSVGPMKNLSYALIDDESRTSILIDPGFEACRFIDFLNKNELSLQSILLTHGHFDHVNAVPEILAKYDIPVFLSRDEAFSLTPKFVSHFFKNKDILKFGNSKIMVFSTPGHTPGSVCFSIDQRYLLTGDTLFINGCGRCDFDSSKPIELYHSLSFLKSLNENYVILPGHDYGPKRQSLLFDERKSNPYLLANSYAQFYQIRMK